MEKSGAGGVGGAATINEIVVLCVKLPLRPVTVILYVPTVVLVATSTVKIEIAKEFDGGITLVGFKVVFTPFIFADVTSKSTSWLKPNREVTAMTEVFESPF